jgi:hypothetical protein
MQGPGCSIKFLGVVWSGKTQVIPNTVIDRLGTGVPNTL